MTRKRTGFEALVPIAFWHVGIGLNPMFQFQEIFG